MVLSKVGKTCTDVDDHKTSRLVLYDWKEEAIFCQKELKKVSVKASPTTASQISSLSSST